MIENEITKDEKVENMIYEISVNGKIKCRNSVKNFVGFPTFFIC